MSISGWRLTNRWTNKQAVYVNIRMETNKQAVYVNIRMETNKQAVSALPP